MPDVVPYRRRRQRSHQRCDPAAATSATPERRERAAGREQVRQPERPPITAVRAFLLDLGLAAERSEPLGDPPGRAPLAVGRRRPLERRKLVDRGSPIGAIGR
jgi:hypothetical protein